MDSGRREFSKLTALTVLGGASLCVAGCAGAAKGSATLTGDTLKVVLAENPELAEVDGSVAIDAGGRKLLVVNRGEAGYLAIDRKCTHMGCGVQWDAQATQAACPCHGSRFSVQGTVEKGPAKKPLQVYATEAADGVLSIAVA